VKQKVLTPDCPRCRTFSLWAVPCPGENCGGEHYQCERCELEWVYREGTEEWLRFDPEGRILEILPPRVARFKRRPSL
jgi:hypothetical protein